MLWEGSEQKSRSYLSLCLCSLLPSLRCSLWSYSPVCCPLSSRWPSGHVQDWRDDEGCNILLIKSVKKGRWPVIESLPVTDKLIGFGKSAIFPVTVMFYFNAAPNIYPCNCMHMWALHMEIKCDIRDTSYCISSVDALYVCTIRKLSHVKFIYIRIRWKYLSD